MPKRLARPPGRQRRASSSLSQLAWSAAAAIGGAAIMYTLDPNAGRRRRARVRDEANHFTHATIRGAQKGLDDGANRLRAVLPRGKAGRPDSVDDLTLADRVRTTLGHYVTHPRAIEVRARSGTVQLRGHILTKEVDAALAHAARTRGVAHVVDTLERHDSPEGVSALQGATSRRRGRGSAWPPGVRWGAGAAGALLGLSGIGRAGLFGSAATILGAGLVLRAATNRRLDAVLGARPGAREIDIIKTLTVRAPVGDVFDQFTRCESFPRVTRRIREAKHLDGGRWHWKVDGPAGIPFEWDSIVTNLVPSQYVAWESCNGASVRNRGDARFEAMPDGATRVTLHFHYEPPLGDVGHAIAKLFGADPKHELDEDMLRFKSLLERGKATGRQGAVTREELRAVKD
jgi:uncharacterized membrane protein